MKDPASNGMIEIGRNDKAIFYSNSMTDSINKQEDDFKCCIAKKGDRLEYLLTYKGNPVTANTNIEAIYYKILSIKIINDEPII